MGAASDGGYLGADFEAFFSAVMSGAAGVYVGVLLQDAGIETDLVVQPGQRVSVSSDPSLPQSRRWGEGGFLVEQRSSLSLRSIVMPTVIVRGGELNLAQMVMNFAQLSLLFADLTTTTSVVRLSEVTVLDSSPELEALTGSVTWDADGAVVYDPPGYLPQGLVRFPVC
jgi:hypothetical protein